MILKIASIVVALAITVMSASCIAYFLGGYALGFTVCWTTSFGLFTIVMTIYNTLKNS